MTRPSPSIQLLALEAIPSDRRPHDYQAHAWDALQHHFETQNGRAGVLVVPTGGGKTFITSHFLLDHHVRQGGRVLWLAHRRSLLVQAMEEFQRLRNVAHPKKSLGLARISSSDAGWSEVDRQIDVAFSTIQSAIVGGNSDFVQRFVEESSHGLYVVVDEAHHAAAPSYARLLVRLREHGAKLLGLTATPVRTEEEDQRRLHALFDGKLVYEISRRELTERGFLAVPVFETVKTEVQLERDFTPADYDYLRRFGDLGPEVLARLATHAHRNALIARHYAERRLDYGPTLVFAADTLHAKTLAKAFQERGVDADYVDYTRADAAEIMQGYRTRKQPSVLVNVEMLTEGFDAPHTRTVFIARPTRSEGLLMQMVGRALRGRSAGGNDRAHLVTFLDTWEKFNVLDARYVLGDGDVVEIPEHRPAPDRGQLVPIPYELVLEAYRLLQSVTKGTFVGVFQCLPYGWYAWEQLYSNDAQRRVVLVFENQVDGFERMLAAYVRPEDVPEAIDEAFARQLVREYFADLPDPLPRWEDVLDLLSAKRAEADVVFYTFEQKKSFDPQEIAQRFAERNTPPNEQRQELQRIWDENRACRHVYREDIRSFHEEVLRESMALLAPPAPELPPKLITLVRAAPRPWPPGELGYSLIRIRDTVVNQPRNFPKGPPVIDSIKWSRNAMRATWGFFRPLTKEIRINCVLNSPDIPLFVLEFLMHHELLHAEMPHCAHDREFRAREYAFVPSEAAVADARSRGVEPGAGAHAWRTLADQFFGTFDRYYEAKRPGTTLTL